MAPKSDGPAPRWLIELERWDANVADCGDDGDAVDTGGDGSGGE